MKNIKLALLITISSMLIQTAKPIDIRTTIAQHVLHGAASGVVGALLWIPVEKALKYLWNGFVSKETENDFNAPTSISEQLENAGYTQAPERLKLFKVIAASVVGYAAIYLAKPHLLSYLPMFNK